jgi:hypothetical protein
VPLQLEMKLGVLLQGFDGLVERTRRFRAQ